MPRLDMAGVQAGISQAGDSIVLIFDGDERMAVEMNLDAAIALVGLLCKSIQEVKGLEELKSSPPTTERGT